MEAVLWFIKCVYFFYSSGIVFNLRYESQISVLKIVQNVQKWLINVSEEPDARNATLTSRTSLNKFRFAVKGMFS